MARQPANLIQRLFEDMSAVLDLEVFERYDLDDAGQLRLVAFGATAVPGAERTAGTSGGSDRL